MTGKKVLMGSAAAVIAIAIGVLGGSFFRHDTQPKPASETKTPSVCENTPPVSVPAKFLRTEAFPMDLDTSASYTAQINTSCGTMYVRLLPKQSPIAVNNFVHLAKEHWFNGLLIHRISADGEVFQAGDPESDGTGSPGYTIDDDTSSLPYKVGSLIMVGTGQPNTGGSEFMVIAGPSGLDQAPGATVFGQLQGDSSLQVAQRILTVPGKSPAEDVWIKGVHLQVKA